MCTWLGVGNDPRYTPTTCFETFPFPAGLTPRDTAHQRNELLESGALIPADLSADKSESNVPLALVEYAQAAIKKVANTATISVRQSAIQIATAAHRLNSLRENWLTPHRVDRTRP